MSDLIDRQAAIDALGKAPKFKIGLLKKYAEGRNDQWFDDVAALVKLPSAQPERIRGHWVNGRCDKCNEHAPFWAMASTYYESNFCPNCGADMRGEDK